MRLLLTPAFLGQHGGFENFVEALAQVAIDAGHEVRILTPHTVQKDATIVVALGADVPFASAQDDWRETLGGGLRYRLGRAWYRARARRPLTPGEDILVSRLRARPFITTYWTTHGARFIDWADVVHLVGKPKAFLLDAARAAVNARKPVVYSEVAQVTAEYTRRTDHAAFVAEANLCDRFHVYAHAQAADIRAHFGFTGEIRAVDQWAYRHEARLIAIDRSQRQAGAGALVFGSLMRLGPEKGLPMLIEAFAAARRSVPDIRLVLCGSGPMRTSIERAVRDLGVADAVTFSGHVADPVSFYSSVDVFIIASDEEGGPITGVEAMAAGLPIVSTTVGAMPERLPHRTASILVQPQAASEMSDAIVRVATDGPLRQRLGVIARSRYIERNHSEKLRPELLKLWEFEAASRAVHVPRDSSRNPHSAAAG